MKEILEKFSDIVEARANLIKAIDSEIFEMLILFRKGDFSSFKYDTSYDDYCITWDEKTRELLVFKKEKFGVIKEPIILRDACGDMKISMQRFFELFLAEFFKDLGEKNEKNRLHPRIDS